MCKIMEELREEAREEGREEGIEEGIEKGIEKGRFDTSCRNAVKMLKRGNLSVEDIAEDFELPLETVKELAEKYVTGSAE